MASQTGSNTDEEDLALALRLSRLSSDAFDEHISQHYRAGSASPSPVPRPNTLEQNSLALALSIAQRSPDAAEEQVSGSLVGVIIWGEADSMLHRRDCFIKISEVPETLKPTLEGHSQVIETSKLVGVTIWGETDSLPHRRDRFIKIGKVPKTLKPTKE